MTKTLQIIPFRYQTVTARKSDGVVSYAKVQVEEFGVIDMRAGDVVSITNTTIEITDAAHERITANVARIAAWKAANAAEDARNAAELRASYHEVISALMGADDVKARAKGIVDSMSDRDIIDGRAHSTLLENGITVSEDATPPCIASK